MAEQVEGSFCFTVLAADNALYFVKGDSPLCLYHYPASGLYLYASTEEILIRALAKMKHRFCPPVKISLPTGVILRIDPRGELERDYFDTTNLFFPAGWSLPRSCCTPLDALLDETYLAELKTVAQSCGYRGDIVDEWISDGLTLDEIEDLLYCGEL